MTRMSSCLTGSPTLFSHSPISTSVTDSPTEGTFNSTGTLASPSDHRRWRMFSYLDVIFRTVSAACRSLDICRSLDVCRSLSHRHECQTPRTGGASEGRERSGDQLLLLEPVRAGRAGCRARRLV